MREIIRVDPHAALNTSTLHAGTGLAIVQRCDAALRIFAIIHADTPSFQGLSSFCKAPGWVLAIPYLFKAA